MSMPDINATRLWFEGQRMIGLHDDKGVMTEIEMSWVENPLGYSRIGC